MTSIYLDYNATVPVRPEALDLMNEILKQPYNASAIHSYGQNARKYIETARQQIASLCGAEPNQLIFNSCSTEGNNTVLQHFAGKRVLISAVEHASVREVLPDAQHIPVDKSGVVDLEALENMLKAEETALVSVMWVQNETGVIQPVQDVASLAHQYGALFHCDGVQAAGKIPINMAQDGIDFLTLSAHKFGGPQGLGVLVLGSDGEIPILLHGGKQERSTRAGTPNVANIAAAGLAAEIITCHSGESRNRVTQDDHISKLEKLRDHLEEELLKTNPNIVIFGQDAPRVCNTSMFAVPGVTSDRILIAMDLEGIAISSGSACSSGSVKPSSIIRAMGYDDSIATCGIRLSMGWNTKEEDVERFLEIWKRAKILD